MCHICYFQGWRWIFFIARGGGYNPKAHKDDGKKLIHALAIKQWGGVEILVGDSLSDVIDRYDLSFEEDIKDIVQSARDRHVDEQSCQHF